MNTSSSPAFRFHMPTEVVIGPGCFNELGSRFQSLGARAFVVTGKHSARKSGVLDKALVQLSGAVVFDEVDENPATELCERAAEVCKAHNCDCVVAIGGGSPMDVAKAAAGLVRNPGPCRGFFGSEKLAAGALPIIAIPTTAGTGSEVTPYAVLVDTADHVKRTITSKCIFPAVALLDPELSVSMPSHITANTGLDALSQAMEGIASRKSNPLCDALALDACRIIARWLPIAVRDGADIEARGWMLHAAMLSGCVIAHTGTTLVHGMGYYFTLEYGVPHGLANGLLLTPLFQHNALYVPEKVASISTELGHPAEATPEDASKKIGQVLHALLVSIGVSPAAKDSGVKSNRLKEFAEHISTDPYRFRNQVGQVGPENILIFFQAAYDGFLAPVK